MAIDMGGPINKAAYVFGTGMLSLALEQPDVATAAYISMAAVMVGGMVPPIGIALACKVFPKKFTAAERSSWVSNIVMGCSFITRWTLRICNRRQAGSLHRGLAHWFPCNHVLIRYFEKRCRIETEMI